VRTTLQMTPKPKSMYN